MGSTTSELGALPAEISAADLDRGDRDGVRVGHVVDRRPHTPRAAVVHERRLELGLDAAARDLCDEHDVVSDLELPLTLRGVSSSLVFTPGHDLRGGTLPDWARLAIDGATVPSSATSSSAWITRVSFRSPSNFSRSSIDSHPSWNAP